MSEMERAKVKVKVSYHRKLWTLISVKIEALVDFSNL
jgi:hypothetical protein